MLPALKMDTEGHEPKNASRQPLEAENGNNRRRRMRRRIRKNKKATRLEPTEGNAALLTLGFSPLRLILDF